MNTTLPCADCKNIITVTADIRQPTTKVYCGECVERFRQSNIKRFKWGKEHYRAEH